MAGMEGGHVRAVGAGQGGWGRRAARKPSSSSSLLGEGFSLWAPPLGSVGLPPLLSTSHPSRSELVLQPLASGRPCLGWSGESCGDCFGPLPADVPTGVRGEVWVRVLRAPEREQRGWRRRPPVGAGLPSCRGAPSSPALLSPHPPVSHPLPLPAFLCPPPALPAPALLPHLGSLWPRRSER